MLKNTTGKIPAMVLGCHKLGLGVIRALGIMGVPVVGVYYNESDMGFVSKFVYWRYKAPHPDYDQKGFIDLLVSLGKFFYGSVIIPSDDATQLAVSQNKKVLVKYFKVSCSDWDITEKILQKKNTYKIAKAAGVPVPETLMPGSVDEACTFAKQIGYPCIVKPSLGHKFFEKSRKKMIMVTTEAALAKVLGECIGEKIEMMVQEFVPGDDKCGFNYNSFYKEGRPIVEFTSQKLRLSPPTMGFPRVIVSKQVPEIVNQGRKILGFIGYEGFSCTEFKRDTRSGVFKLMEINGRQNLSTPLAVRCGINFPYLTYMYDGYGVRPAESRFLEGVYWIDAEKDFMELMAGRKSKNIEGDLLKFFTPYLKPKVFSILSVTDPLPVVKRASDIIKVGFARLRRK